MERNRKTIVAITETDVVYRIVAESNNQEVLGQVTQIGMFEGSRENQPSIINEAEVLVKGGDRDKAYQILKNSEKIKSVNIQIF
jgi:hypothetical protein